MKDEPNEETIQAMQDVDNDENLIEHRTLDEFWEALGLLNI